MRRGYRPQTVQAARKQVMVGLAFIAVGVGISIISYTAAKSSGGGFYIIGFGPVIGGIIRLATALPLALRSNQMTPPPGPYYPGQGMPPGGYAGRPGGYPGQGMPRGGLGAPPPPFSNQPGGPFADQTGAPAGPASVNPTGGFGGPAASTAPWAAGSAAGAWEATSSVPAEPVAAAGPVGGTAAADTPVAGWYPDPRSPQQARWWDGGSWTDHTRAV